MLRDLATAVRLLTVLPLGKVDGRHPARWFGFVGWGYAALGVSIASAAAWTGRADGLSALVAGGIVVAASAAVSGFLHFDGLADVADGLGVRGDAARRLEVMRDSAVGAFGVTAVVLAIVLQVVATAVVIESRSWWALGAAPIIGRWAAGVALATRRSARADGLAARYAAREPAGALVLQALPLAPLFVAVPSALPAKAAAVCVCLALGLLVPLPFVRRFGGITGDVLGATVVLTETAVLVLGALAGGWL